MIRFMKNTFFAMLGMVTCLLAQGINFPNDPAQAPIGGLGLLAAAGAALAYKKLKKK